MSENATSYRRLSPWRVLLAILLIVGLGMGSFFGTQRWQAEQKQDYKKPWFAPYVDVTATPTFPFEEVASTKTREVILSFIVSLPSDACTPSWGGAYTLDQAGASLDLDRRIARLKQQGGNVAVSFGGLKNDELAVKCTDEEKLYKAYKSIVERYNIDTVDLDLELGALTNTDAALRRASVIARLQSERRAKGKKLAVWVTLPVAPQGLTQDGTKAVSYLLIGGVDLAGVNVMAMDYGDSLEKGKSMLTGSVDALTNTHRQLGILYEQADKHLNSVTLWSKIGATPMIGQNDNPAEVFTLADAQQMLNFARTQGMARLSFWSLGRDNGGCAGNKTASASCSGVSQGQWAFSNIFGAY